MLADAAFVTDLRALALVVAAVGSTATAVLGLSNRARLSTKEANGGVTMFGRPKKKTIGDVLAELLRVGKELEAIAAENHELNRSTQELARLLVDRTPRFDRIEGGIRDAVREGNETTNHIFRELEMIRLAAEAAAGREVRRDTREVERDRRERGG